MLALRIVVAIAALAATTAGAPAQEWPTRPVTMVVPFAAGGAFDVIGRVFAPRLSEILHQQVIVENVGAAAGIVGTNRVARAAADGEMFLLGTIGTHAYNAALYKKLPYNPVTDFAPVGLFVEQPMVLVTRKDFPANGLQEFIAYGKANGAKMQYGSAGVGSTTHLACALLNVTAGLNVTHIPYRGGGPAMADVIAGQVHYMCSNTPGALPQIAGGTLKGIAMLARERSPVAPDLPTAHEQGLKDFDIYSWNAVFLPKGTPPEIVGKLNAALSKVMDNPAVRSKLEDLGLYVVAPEERSPAHLAAFVRSEIEKWEAPIRSSGATGE